MTNRYERIRKARQALESLRKSPWGEKLADTAGAVDRAADKGTLAIAALEAAREDAERYRWLRDREIPEWMDLWHQNPDRIDAAIDQARRKEARND